jgi:hypothetical protein
MSLFRKKTRKIISAQPGKYKVNKPRQRPDDDANTLPIFAEQVLPGITDS